VQEKIIFQSLNQNLSLQFIRLQVDNQKTPLKRAYL
jgi:hypothetical protein